MSLLSTIVNVVAATAAFALIAFVLWRIARWARRRPGGAYVLGALIIPIGGMGNVSDPEYKMVNEAQQPKRQEEDDSGDPPTDHP
jgi:hypothetical protein